ncbi:hypothetical protein P691DRAFT_770166 [Macrolepiota fuliginosa MF-IS2]|uniref:SH3 domain-binding glutamic acid-rich protein n=1 Tax=Macrolepiota fuliginosa MF-IS2 TaxID=1400762 RepID=A0A9P6CBF8_9AGAR|nr:hypothetical protein P691DRAFT_770166 [Macrolepiota fuliginosa MF-IS2]
MPSPPIAVFLTTIASQPALRQRQEYLLRILQVKKIPFTSYDLASDEDAKRLWKRKAPPDKQQLPGILVGGSFPGTFQDFEEAVEYGELDRFLRLSEKWNDNEDSLLSGPKLPEAKPVGVPGAMMPLQMTPEHLKKKILAQPPPSPLAGGAGGRKKPIPVNKRVGEMDLGDELSGYGLQGVKVTEDELLDLVKDLGLDDDAAGDLVKGLGGSSGKDKVKEVDKSKGELKKKVDEVAQEVDPVKEQAKETKESSSSS